jgi:hypothetical protein
MSMQIKVPNADFSGLGFPKLVKQVAGFRVPDLQALYLFENGVNGDAVVSAVDSSGLGRHASLVTGSVAPLKAASGVNKPTAAGSFLYTIPAFALGQAFSAVVVARCSEFAASKYPTLWRPSPDITGGSLVNSQSGGEAINFEMGSGTGLAQPGWYNVAGSMDATSSIVRAALSVPGTVRTDWVAVAFSYNPATDTYSAIAGPVSFSFSRATPSNVSKAKVGLHTFGIGKFSSISDMPGDLGLFALYSGYKTVDELQDLASRAKARMALRGVAVF